MIVRNFFSKSLVIASALVLAGCQTASDPSAGVVAREGVHSTSITVKNPDPTKWVVSQPPPNPRARMWLCRPLACSGKSGIAVETLNSPTSKPDAKALEKLAKLQSAQTTASNSILAIASDGTQKVEVISSNVVTLRGYPGIKVEQRKTTSGQKVYTVAATLFIGALAIKVISVAEDLQEARKNFNEYVNALEIDDRPPPSTKAGQPQ